MPTEWQGLGRLAYFAVVSEFPAKFAGVGCPGLRTGSTTSDVYWYTNHVSSSASIHWQFYKREITLTGIRLDLPRSMLRGALSEK